MAPGARLRTVIPPVLHYSISASYAASYSASCAASMVGHNTATAMQRSRMVNPAPPYPIARRQNPHAGLD